MFYCTLHSALISVIFSLFLIILSLSHSTGHLVDKLKTDQTYFNDYNTILEKIGFIRDINRHKNRTNYKIHHAIHEKRLQKHAKIVTEKVENDENLVKIEPLIPKPEIPHKKTVIEIPEKLPTGWHF